ncbi:unnamed protein product [Hydatigera taeniaeformis]|uniref:Ribosome-recycling factor, mitochondrial n=1 Tax=Hydatigena taeniaeformis TaxID=6205 RepID=A0A0R3X6B8_HYDTA|nr:unnamed protein product [Hydatigera taeniaeformis]
MFMISMLSRPAFRIFLGDTISIAPLRSISRIVLLGHIIKPGELRDTNRHVILHQPLRSKGRSKVRRDSVKIVDLTDELRQKIREEEMIQEYAKVVARFKDDLYRKLCLKLTPEILYSIPIPGERIRLGEVATITSHTSVQSSNVQPISQILIDLSGRPDLVTGAKLAISQFLSEDAELPSSKRAKASSYSDLIQDINQTQFTVRLRTLVTGDVRHELSRKGSSPRQFVNHLHTITLQIGASDYIDSMNFSLEKWLIAKLFPAYTAPLFIQGWDMLHQTKKEMDRIYQRFSKSVAAMKSLSEDDKRVATEHLKTVVKAQHTAVEQVWKAKEEELLNA